MRDVVTELITQAEDYARRGYGDISDFASSVAKVLKRRAWRASKSTEHPSTMLVADILRDYRDGDEHGWDTEFAYLRDNHAEKLDMLATSIQEVGMLTPILLGYDGRVWDGHHRLCVAQTLGIKRVSVMFNEAPSSDVELRQELHHILMTKFFCDDDGPAVRELEDAILPLLARASQLNAEPHSVKEWRVEIAAERARQIQKGYTPAHDRERGLTHLASWAIDYARRGKTVEASALVLAMLDVAEGEK